MSKLVFLDDVKRDDHTVLTVGTFDGVHEGHKVLIQSVLNKAEECGCRSVIVTFDPHPRDIINPGSDGIKLLSTLSERCELLADLGIDEMVVIPFDRDFSLMSSETFIREVIWKKIGVKKFVIGYDHQFGKDREGTIETVRALGEELSFESHVVSKQEVENKTVSSTSIRNALQGKGDVEQAEKFLGRYYILNGTVVHGDKRGKEIGYPTANIQIDLDKKIIPKKGVYAVWARVDGEYYPAMMNIGFRPTFKGEGLTMEVHIISFDENIYGKEIQVQFVKRIRDEQSFDGVEALKEQLAKDKMQAVKILKTKRPNVAKQTN
ncbi:bifunctional riboflavin kinase/FAD synthetase [Rhodohalobacter sp. SW132]|uniref:bifunctional riboflavin kinase/FAD synthetase n=1 Tax=Rhodohalobacter sp. SW132 TaxID=2293433 RepID=UPI000E28A057|nr:bifunctional riboflavin kinase/FAD synthetase [Rhodohalobacter sp. SW132]REL33626.1 bifunctional riboflavin kinase/FAD synthetase [Rhodohalobacter sp. SW132]